MSGPSLRRHAPQLVALAIVTSLYGVARLPAMPGAGRKTLASPFRFEGRTIPAPGGDVRRFVRPVHPSLRHLSGWISAVGAGIAAGDLDGDGLPNDLVHIDPRIDRVVATPAPGTPPRYRPFLLEPDPLPYDADTSAPMGCLICDLDEDGRMDVLVYYWGRSPIAFLRDREPESGRGLGGLDFMRSEIAPDAGRWFTNAVALSDLDGDGHADLIIGNYFADDANILDARGMGREEMQDSMSRAFNAGRNRVLRRVPPAPGSGPSVRFEEVRGALEEEAALGWTLALGTADLDGDLLPEIYFANDFGPDRLLHNRSKPGEVRLVRLEGRRHLTTPRSKVLGLDSFKGMGVDFGDLDGDGILDFYVSNIADEYALEESHFAFLGTGQVGLMKRGVAPYADRSEPLGLSRSGWGWDAKLVDFDNDGVPEIVQALGFLRGRVNRWPELQELAMGNDDFLREPGSWPIFQPGDDISGHHRNGFWVREASGRFWDVSAELGMAEPGVSRGIASADVDGDGRMDFAVANQWADSTFYHNRSPSPGQYLGLHLLLPLRAGLAPRTLARPGHPGADTPGRPALGAEATLTLPDGRRLTAQVDCSNGHSGRRSPDLHFGLGRLDPGASLTVHLRWRDPTGRVRREALDLTPGWHTVRLAWTSDLESTSRTGP